MKADALAGRGTKMTGPDMNPSGGEIPKSATTDPIVIGHQARRSAPGAAVPEGAPAAAPLGRILVVDDERELMVTLVEALARQGYETRGFDNGRQALETLKAEAFDILMVDLMMPGMDGLTVMKAALEMDQDLVMIMMTGQGTVQTAVEAMKRGAFDYILKPFKLAGLLPLLTRATEVRRLRQENLELRETVGVYQLCQAIAFTLDPNTIVGRVAEAALQQVEADEVSVMMPLPGEDQLTVVAIRGEARQQILGHRVPIEAGIAGWVARTRQAVLLQGKVDDDRFEPEAPRPEVHSAISVPLMTGGNLVGVLNVNATKRARAFTLRHVKALNLLAGLAAPTIAEASLVQRLRQAEERYRSIFENSVEGIFQAVADDGFLVANEALARILGYESPRELISRVKNVGKELFLDPHRYEEFLRGLRAEGSLKAFEFEARRKDGGPIWLSANIRAHVDSRPANLQFEGTIEDVTPRRRAEEKIRRQLNRLGALRRIDLAISGSLDLRVTLSVVLDQVVNQLGVDAAAVLLLNPHTLNLDYSAGRGFTGEAIRRSSFRLGEGLPGRVALERQRADFWVGADGDPAAHERLATLKGEGFIAYCGVPLVTKGLIAGVMEIFHRSELRPDEEWIEFLEALAGQAAIAIDNATLFENLQRSNADLSLAYETTLLGWSRALDLRDKETEGHTERVTEMTVRLAGRMGIASAELVQIRRGALLHDIGKMGIPDSILLKPGPLTDDEWIIMRKHPDYAHALLSPIAYLRPALDIPYCHHERWDGKGYPRGLKGDQIPLAARIFAVVDVWDALHSDRPYRPAWAAEKIREHIASGAGSHFDPDIVKAFLEMMADNGRT